MGRGRPNRTYGCIRLECTKTSLLHKTRQDMRTSPKSLYNIIHISTNIEFIKVINISLELHYRGLQNELFSNRSQAMLTDRDTEYKIEKITKYISVTCARARAHWVCKFLDMRNTVNSPSHI